MKRFLITAAVVAGLGWLVGAGVALSLSHLLRGIDPQVRIDNLGDYPDRVFYLEYQRGNGNPHQAPRQTVQLTPGETVTLPGTGRNLVLTVVAAPRGQGAEAPGAVRASAPQPYLSAVGSLSVYRVTLKDGDLTVTEVSGRS